MRTIDADKLKRELDHRLIRPVVDDARRYDQTDIMDIIDEQETVLVVPKPDGRWEETPTTIEVQEILGCSYDTKVYKCSVCGNVVRVRSTYCPICGARMW